MKKIPASDPHPPKDVYHRELFPESGVPTPIPQAVENELFDRANVTPEDCLTGIYRQALRSYVARMNLTEVCANISTCVESTTNLQNSIGVLETDRERISAGIRQEEVGLLKDQERYKELDKAMQTVLYKIGTRKSGLRNLLIKLRQTERSIAIHKENLHFYQIIGPALELLRRYHMETPELLPFGQMDEDTARKEIRTIFGLESVQARHEVETIPQQKHVWLATALKLFGFENTPFGEKVGILSTGHRCQTLWSQTV